MGARWADSEEGLSSYDMELQDIKFKCKARNKTWQALRKCRCDNSSGVRGKGKAQARCFTLQCTSAGDLKSM